MASFRRWIDLPQQGFEIADAVVLLAGIHHLLAQQWATAPLQHEAGDQGFPLGAAEGR